MSYLIYLFKRDVNISNGVCNSCWWPLWYRLSELIIYFFRKGIKWRFIQRVDFTVINHGKYKTVYFLEKDE